MNAQELRVTNRKARTAQEEVELQRKVSIDGDKTNQFIRFSVEIDREDILVEIIDKGANAVQAAIRLKDEDLKTLYEEIGEWTRE